MDGGAAALHVAADDLEADVGGGAGSGGGAEGVGVGGIVDEVAEVGDVGRVEEVVFEQPAPNLLDVGLDPAELVG